MAFKDCGSHAAYVRHRRAGERACDECKRAESEYRRSRYAAVELEQVQKVKAAFESDAMGSDGDVVRQNVGRGVVVDVAVPEIEGELEAALWNLRQVRAAMLTATPRDVAALSRAHEDLMERVGRLRAAKVKAESGGGLREQLQRAREERLRRESERVF